MAIDVQKDSNSYKLSDIFSDKNPLTRGAKDLAALFYDVAVLPIRQNVMLVNAASKSSLPGATVPLALVPAVGFLALTAPAGLAVTAGVYLGVNAFMHLATNIYVGMGIDLSANYREEAALRNFRTNSYPTVAQRIANNKARKQQTLTR